MQKDQGSHTSSGVVFALGGTGTCNAKSLSKLVQKDHGTVIASSYQINIDLPSWSVTKFVPFTLCNVLKIGKE